LKLLPPIFVYNVNNRKIGRVKILKKIITSFALVGTLGIGGILTYSMIGEDTPKESSTDNKVSAANEAKEAVAVEVPKERTVNTNGDAPWKYMSTDQIKNAQDKGEVVYLFSDVEGIEAQIQNLVITENTEPYSKEDLAEGWANELSVFIEGVEKYHLDKKSYFDKLREVQTALSTHNYESTDKLIKEAKTLR
jgi:hypothetical protein